MVSFLFFGDFSRCPPNSNRMAERSLSWKSAASTVLACRSRQQDGGAAASDLVRHIIPVTGQRPRVEQLALPVFRP
jgi:hypothetical protein